MRKEKDSMGDMEVPDDALYGASTQRAVLNFNVSTLKFSPAYIAAVGLIKQSAAKANKALKLLAPDKADAIIKAAQEVIDGTLYKHFVVDIFQTGSGTSTNMNANEVIANRAIAILGAKCGDKSVIHPNDHVNMCQSSNDVIPSAIHVAAVLETEKKLLPALHNLHRTLDSKAKSFAKVIKSGRTHLQDATPITLGQEFSGYATQVASGIARIESALPRMRELALGGTAVGTGLNTHPEFAKTAIEFLSQTCGSEFIEAPNHFEAQAARDAAVELSGQIKVVACSLLKIANDIRWLSSGPRCAIGEITLPETQPGSSIMPAKVNPVICESLMMAAVHVCGNDLTVTLANQQGNFELNVMMPILAHNLLQAIEVLAGGAQNFNDKCAVGIEPINETCEKYAEMSLANATSLAPIIGYDKAGELAKRAMKENKTVRQVAQEMKVLPEAELTKALDLFAMTKPGL